MPADRRSPTSRASSCTPNLKGGPDLNPRPSGCEPDPGYRLTWGRARKAWSGAIVGSHRFVLLAVPSHALARWPIEGLGSP